jgi:MurNAc alpha-1-phosphate uridylyltransferase
MILAAGRGERMRPLTDAVPKPMLEAGGKPLIVWMLEALARAGVCDVVINTAHLGNVIEAGIGDGSKQGVRVMYSREAQALETAGGIRYALPLLGADPFIVVNGDIYTDYPLGELVAAARRLCPEGPLAHLVLVPNPSHHPEGDFCLEQGVVSREGPQTLTFSGMGAYHPALFGPVEHGSKARLAALLSPHMARGDVTGVAHQGLWTDVGTPARLAELDGLLRSAEGSAPSP